MENENPLFVIKNLYLQKDFSSQTKKKIQHIYGAADEDLLCAVWTNPVLRKGFLVTDKALRWHLTGKDGCRAEGAFIKKENSSAEFSIGPFISEENATQTGDAATMAEELSLLEVTADEKTYRFFIKGLAEEKGKTLCDILKFGYTQGGVPETDLDAFVKSMPLLAVRSFVDGVPVFLRSLPARIMRLFRTDGEGAGEQSGAGDAFANVTENEREAERVEEAVDESANGLQQKMTAGDRLRIFLLAVLDICASLVFVATVIIAIKPQLLPFAKDKTVFEPLLYFDKIGGY